MQGEVVIGGDAPEPSTWAMIALGFAGLAFTAFHQRKTPAFAA